MAYAFRADMFLEYICKTFVFYCSCINLKSYLLYVCTCKMSTNLQSSSLHSHKPCAVIAALCILTLQFLAEFDNQWVENALRGSRRLFLLVNAHSLIGSVFVSDSWWQLLRYLSTAASLEELQTWTGFSRLDNGKEHVDENVSYIFLFPVLLLLITIISIIIIIINLQSYRFLLFINNFYYL